MDPEALTPIRHNRSAYFVMPVALLVLAWALVWAWPQIARTGQGPLTPDLNVRGTDTASLTTYALLALVFLPLTAGRKYPLTVLGITTLASAAYLMVPGNPPAPTVLAPLIALFLVGSTHDRRTVWTAFAAATGITLLATIHPFTGTTWIGDAIATTALFGVAASAGDATRNRRAYILAVEQRAADAERTREEEAQRRVEEERLRIARELHDVTAHSLSIIALQAGAAEKAVTRDPQAAIRALRTIRTTSKESLDELRAMLGVLRSADEDAPLSPAGRLERLPELVRTVEDAGIHMTLDVSGDISDIPAYADVSAFRIVQEAITNVVRHAQAQSVNVVLRDEDDALFIEVTDDGRGVEQGSAEGHGLAGMRERATALGGTFEAGPAADGGFRVRARLPLVKGTQRRER